MLVIIYSLYRHQIELYPRNEGLREEFEVIFGNFDIQEISSNRSRLDRRLNELYVLLDTPLQYLLVQCCMQIMQQNQGSPDDENADVLANVSAIRVKKNKTLEPLPTKPQSVRITYKTLKKVLESTLTLAKADAEISSSESD